MEHPLRLLIVDDEIPDAELTAQQIARGGLPCTWRRVETEAAFRAQLREFSPDLIISDFSLPQYDGLSALELAVGEAPGIPFIFVSGSIGEKRATEARNRGAADYVSKDDRTRLVPTVVRVLAAHGSSAHEATPERIRRLGRALQVLSEMRVAGLSAHTRNALLTEACRIIHESGQYAYSFIALADPNGQGAHTVAWAGAGAQRGRGAQFHIPIEQGADPSVVARVLRTGELQLCLDVDQYRGTLCECEREATQPGGAFVSLPLCAGEAPVGTLTVGAARRVYISEPEILLLERLGNQISKALRRTLTPWISGGPDWPR
jgi:CheY-like chemotaxis protein